jgi:hypothetical protein
LQSDGTLWSWGRNDFGQLGLSNTTNRSSPEQVGSLLWKKIENHKAFSSFVIQSNGTLWAWGRNTNGTLGLGNLVDTSSPIQVGSANNWSQVTGGMGFVYGFSLGVQSNGTLFGWGSNFYGAPYVSGSIPTKISLYDLTTQRIPNRIGNENYWAFYGGTTSISGDAISNNIIKISNVIAGNIGNTIFANDIIEFSATNNTRAYSTITNVDWANNLIYMQDNVFLTFANVAFASKSASSNIININTLTGQYDGNFRNLTRSNNIFFVGDSVSLNNDGGNYIITKVFANGNFSVSDQYGFLPSGPIANTRITVNKNANTQSVMIYGSVGQYDTPQLVTENEEPLLTESGLFILIG